MVITETEIRGWLQLEQRYNWNRDTIGTEIQLEQRYNWNRDTWVVIIEGRGWLQLKWVVITETEIHGWL